MEINGVKYSGTLTCAKDGSLTLKLGRVSGLSVGMNVEIYTGESTYVDRSITSISGTTVICKLQKPPLSELEMLKKQVSAQSEMLDFYEECIAEMAAVVYA